MEKNLFIETIQKADFFQNLDIDILDEIASVSSLHKYCKNQILYYESDDVDNIYYLLEGSIKFYKVDRFDNEIFLYKVHAPRLIYDISKLADFLMMQCFSNAEFDTDSTILSIDAKIFKETFLHNEIFMQKILNESFQTIAQLQCIINRDVVFDGTAKVAHFLVIEGETFNKLKKHEIAYMLHIQPETLSRILKKLVRNGIIEIEKNQVKIIKMNELKEIYQ